MSVQDLGISENDRLMYFRKIPGVHEDKKE